MTSEDRDVPDEQRLDDEGASRSSTFARHSVSDASKARPPKKHMPIWQESILLLGIALLLAVVIKAFLVQAFYIPSESMEPGLIEDDRILVQKWSYWGDDGPERGDVVVFKDPGGWLAEAESKGATSLPAKVLSKVGLFPTGGHLVKRVIGVEGDVITCCDAEGRLMVNGHPLEEDGYVMAGATCAAPGVDCTLEVGPIPEGHLFVMGDNRARSDDSSRKVCRENETDCSPTRGFVPVENVVGKVFTLVWPWQRWDHITRPDTFDAVPDDPPATGAPTTP